MVEAGALGSFGGKALQFLRPILSGNKVVVRSLSHAPHSIDASRLRHAVPSSWFKSGYIQKTSIAMAEIETTTGKVERVMAVSGKAWHGTNAPKSIEWQGNNYKIIFNDLVGIPNRGNLQHAEKRIFEYINSYHNQKINVKIAVENTSQSKVGMCTGCQNSIQDLSERLPNMRITMFHGSTKTNP